MAVRRAMGRNSVMAAAATAAGGGGSKSGAGCGTGVDKMSKVFNFSVNATNLKRISNGW